MPIEKVCLLGGSGFIGRHVVATLARRGIATRVITRRRSRARHLLVVPSCELIESADVHSVSSLSLRLAGCDAVINLVGILNERGPGEFRAVHAELPAKIAEACRYNRIRRFVHMSALGAATDAPSEYLRTKGHGEDAAHLGAEDGLEVTSVRPSVVFGPEDDFFNRFAMLLALSPLVFPLACPHARFAPVFVGDVARAIADVLDDDSTRGERFDLCGPREYELIELVEYAARVSGHRRLVIGLGDGASRLQARLLELVPGKPFSVDNYLSMRVPSVSGDNGLDRLGIVPTGLESVVPGYIGRGGRNGFLSTLRSTAGRT